jgi:hypothetical protein
LATKLIKKLAKIENNSYLCTRIIADRYCPRGWGGFSCYIFATFLLNLATFYKIHQNMENSRNALFIRVCKGLNKNDENFKFNELLIFDARIYWGYRVS